MTDLSKLSIDQLIGLYGRAKTAPYCDEAELAAIVAEVRYRSPECLPLLGAAA